MSETEANDTSPSRKTSTWPFQLGPWNQELRIIAKWYTYSHLCCPYKCSCDICTVCCLPVRNMQMFAGKLRRCCVNTRFELLEQSGQQCYVSFRQIHSCSRCILVQVLLVLAVLVSFYQQSRHSTPCRDVWRLFKVFCFVFFPSNLLVSLPTVAAGTGGYDPIHQPGEPGCVPPPHRRPAGHRHVLHRLVLRVSFDSFDDTASCA